MTKKTDKKTVIRATVNIPQDVVDKLRRNARKHADTPKTVGDESKKPKSN